jgi:hypothetical protein
MKAWQVVIWLLIGGILGALALAVFQWKATQQACAMHLGPCKVQKNGGTGSGSLVTVRGGSMTIREINGWTVSTASATTYCTFISTSNALSLSATEVVNANIPPGDTPITSVSSVPLTRNWTVTIVGRIHIPPSSSLPAGNSTLPSPNGIVLRAPVNSECPTSSGKTPVALAVIPGTGSNFYLDDPALHEESNAVTAKRFMDTTPASTSTSTNCSGPNSTSNSLGDEDACERASLITVTTSSGGPYAGSCRNGECIITIDSQ